MRQRPSKQRELWPKIILRKWLNISSNNSDFSADEVDTTESELENEELCERRLRDDERRIDGLGLGSNGYFSEGIPYRLRRRKSETFRVQYINTKELRICVGTWNVGGKLPPENFDLKEWLDLKEPADIYVVGLQEIVPLNAGNIFGAEDNRPVPRWEYLIRETLNSQPVKANYKCYSDPASPSRFMPPDDALVIEDEILHGTDSDSDDEVKPMDEQFASFHMDNDGHSRIRNDMKHNLTSDSTYIADGGIRQELDLHKTSLKILDRSHHLSFKDYEVNSEASIGQRKKLTKTVSSSERIGLIWPEPPLEVVARRALDNSKLFRPVKSFRGCNSFKSARVDCNDSSESGFVPNDILNTIMRKKKRSHFIRIISKQMVGIYLSIWVRRSLRKHVQNLKVSTVGVGVMGYIGNKGSISVSMSIYQTLFCFICCHLTSGEKEGDELRRNADVHEIHRRTMFCSSPNIGFPKAIHDHERIIWLGDLNYRLNLSYERTHQLISKKEWSELIEKDQLRRELKKGHAFDGWSEGTIKFPPTYKYEYNSENYVGDDTKGGRRTPSWCDRILSYGKGLRLLDYRRAELKLSDHRPVTAIFTADVEVLCPRKLQRVLTFTDTDIEDEELISEADIN